ncbi:hypothetical protein ASG03_01470 [Rhizobium sp. Leaf341]|nr:hypothetical protein ASG03_01470 [Rhizobium sp. Leaf341]
MKNGYRIGAVLLAAVLMAGCGPTKPQFQVAVETMKGSKRARDKVTADCIAGFTQTGVQGAALVLDVPEKDAKRVACQRMVAAITAGRLDYEDLQSMIAKRPTAKVVRVMQNR